MQGYFGKASLSKGFPNFGKQKINELNVLNETQWQRRKEWSDKLQKLIENLEVNKAKGECNNSTNDEAKGSTSNTTNSPMDIDNDTVHCNEGSSVSNLKESRIELGSDQELLTKEINLSISKAHSLSESANVEDVLVVDDCKDADNLLKLNPHIEVEPLKTVMEVLYLSLEESFFLSFALGCLQVMDLTGKPLSLLQLWRVFNYSQSNFIENYVAYHYFRAKGWVVKSGLKFGGNFSKFHNSFVFSTLILNLI